MVLGFNGEASPSISKANSVDVNRGSIDSGYHSMIAKPKRGSQGGLSQATTFVNSSTESSPERSPRKLRKAISTTFSGAMQAFSNTVRSSTSYIYPTAGEPELPSSEWAECETPKKQSRRSSIMSSIRSRKRFTPRARDEKIESPGRIKSPVPVTQEKAPALEVEIPNPSFSYESLGRSSIPRGSQLLAGVNLPTAAKNLWPGPTRMTTDQASGNHRRGTLHPAFSKSDDPYVEQGDGLEHGLSFITSATEFALESPSPEAKKRYLSDDKGYFSEVESNADTSESDGLSQAIYAAPGSPEARTSSQGRHEDPAVSHGDFASSASPFQRTTLPQISSPVPSGSEPSKPETLDGTAEQIAPLDPSSRTSSHHRASLEDGLGALFPSYEDVITSESRSLHKRLPSDVYDADAESSKSSMGSRAAWERHRADRERRYMEIIDMAPNTESDEEVGPELELTRSPSKKPVHYAEELVHSTVNIGRSESAPRHATGDLRYAVEAIERPALPHGELAYAVEAIEMPSVTTFDPLETVFQQRPMSRLSDTIDEQDTSRVSGPQELSPSSPPADLSPSRVELPSSPEPSPVDIPAAPKYTMMTMRLTDEELMTFGAGDLDGQSIRRFSCESTDVSENSSPEKQSRTAPGDGYEEGLKAGGLLAPTYLSRSTTTRPVGEDAYEAGLRAAGLYMPTYPSDLAQERAAIDSSYEGDLKATSLFTPIFKETSYSTYREHLEPGSTLPKPRSRNGTPFEHSRTLSAFSDDPENSLAVTTHSPSCNARPPFPSLHVRPEPARRIPSGIDALATFGDEQIRIVGPANAGINTSLSSPFDGPGDQTEEAESKNLSSKILEGAHAPDNYAQMTSLERHDIQSPSPGTTSSIQSPSNGTPQETFTAAKLPGFGSPSLIATKKARRKQKKSSSGMGITPFADITMNPRNSILEPDLSPAKCELNKKDTLGKTQMLLGESARVTGGSVQKPSPNRKHGRKNRRSRDQASLEGFTEIVGDSARWLDPSSKSESSKKSPGGERQAATTLSMTSSPPRMKTPQAKGKLWSDEIHEDAGSAVKDSKAPLEPEFSIYHFDSTSYNPPLYVDNSSGSPMYADHEFDSALPANTSVYSHHKLNDDLQLENDKAEYFTSGDETIGNSSESDKDAVRALGQKKNGKPVSEAEKQFVLQRKLERKSDRACSQVFGKLKSEALGDDPIREDESAHREGRPHWRP